MRKVLLCVSGLSPQVVTETVYALANQQNPWVPDEIWLLTTQKGAEHARLTLFVEDGGWFHRLRQEYGLPPISFDERHIMVVRDQNGAPLDDIRCEADNMALADLITETVRRLCADDEVALHVSLAGGRKTMSFFAGYVLSLFGRSQDRLSHVLVEPAALENHPQFFYPTRQSSPVRDRNGEIMDRAQARVTLSEVPFLRLGHVLDRDVLLGDYPFNVLIERLQADMTPLPVRFDLDAHRLWIGERELARLRGVNYAFYAWMVWRHVHDQGPIEMPVDLEGRGDCNLAREFVRWLRRQGLDTLPHLSRTIETLERDGMTHAFVRDRKNRIKTALVEELGVAGKQYAISGVGRGLQGLSVPPDLFSFA